MGLGTLFGSIVTTCLCPSPPPTTVVPLARSSRHCVRSFWTRALRTTCWRWRPGPSPTTWTCRQSAPAGSSGWTEPSRRCATVWWWSSWTTGPAGTSLSNVLRCVFQSQCRFLNAMTNEIHRSIYLARLRKLTASFRILCKEPKYEASACELSRHGWMDDWYESRPPASPWNQ